MYRQTGKLLPNGDVVTNETYQEYFEKFQKDFIGTYSARLIEVTEEDYSYILKYEVDASECYKCDEEKVVADTCIHDWEETVDYSYVELYA